MTYTIIKSKTGLGVAFITEDESDAKDPRFEVVAKGIKSEEEAVEICGNANKSCLRRVE